jgi:molecular chaperone GrpE
MMNSDEKDEEIIREEEGDNQSFDDVDATDGNALLRIKDLKEKLKVCEKERKEYLDGWQRAKADYLNSTKRFAEERSQIKERAEISLIERILPLCDSFDMALQGEKGDGGVWREGFERIYAQLTTLLKDLGVSATGEIGAPFDPYQHEALSNQKVEKEESHDTVIAVLQKGYKRGDILIRPAKVVIGVFEG